MSKIVNIIRKHMKNKDVEYYYYNEDRKINDYFFCKTSDEISEVEYNIYHDYYWKLWDLKDKIINL